MPKNYYLFFHTGKVKRQAINLNDIYPESYAMDKIPSDADIFAKIITSDVTNERGYMVRFLKSVWLKHALWTSYYPDDLTIEFKDAALFHDAQKDYVRKYLPLLTDAERESLKSATERTLNGLWE
jgi:hypothetical protein